MSLVTDCPWEDPNHKARPAEIGEGVGTMIIDCPTCCQVYAEELDRMSNSTVPQ